MKASIAIAPLLAIVLSMLLAQSFASPISAAMKARAGTASSSEISTGRWCIFIIMSFMSLAALVAVGVYLYRRHHDHFPEGTARIVGVKFFDD